MNRFRPSSGWAGEPPAAGDFFVVSTVSATWYVSRTMAEHVDRTLARWTVPRWVVFVDLSGSRVRQLTSTIEYVAECTAEQRAQYRALRRALYDEDD